jgi:hypothetical protein
VSDDLTADRLVSAIVGVLGDDDLPSPGDVRAELVRDVDAAGPAALLELRGAVGHGRRLARGTRRDV